MDEAVLELMRMGIPPEIAQEVIRRKRQDKFDAETRGMVGREAQSRPSDESAWGHWVPPPPANSHARLAHERDHAKAQTEHLLTVLDSIAGDQNAGLTPASNQVIAGFGRAIGMQPTPFSDPNATLPTDYRNTQVGGGSGIASRKMNGGGNLAALSALSTPGGTLSDMSQGGNSLAHSPTPSPQTPLTTNLSVGSTGNYRPGAGIYLQGPR